MKQEVLLTWVQKFGVAVFLKIVVVHGSVEYAYLWRIIEQKIYFRQIGVISLANGALKKLFKVLGIESLPRLLV